MRGENFSRGGSSGGRRGPRSANTFRNADLTKRPGLPTSVYLGSPQRRQPAQEIRAPGALMPRVGWAPGAAPTPRDRGHHPASPCWCSVRSPGRRSDSASLALGRKERSACQQERGQSRGGPGIGLGRSSHQFREAPRAGVGARMRTWEWLGLCEVGRVCMGGWVRLCGGAHQPLSPASSPAILPVSLLLWSESQ